MREVVRSFAFEPETVAERIGMADINLEAGIRESNGRPGVYRIKQKTAGMVTQACQLNGPKQEVQHLRSRMADYRAFGLCNSSAALRLFLECLLNEAGCDPTDMHGALSILVNIYGTDLDSTLLGLPSSQTLFLLANHVP